LREGVGFGRRPFVESEINNSNEDNPCHEGEQERSSGVVTLSEIGPIWTISQQAKSLKSLASTLAIVGKFRSV
jgi:hypothetical protein